MSPKRSLLLGLALVALGFGFWGCYRLALYSRQRQLDQSLLRAARTGDPDYLQQLLEQGARVNVKDTSPRNSGGTPLIYAAAMCDKVGVHQLLERGADVHARDNGGWTALMWAVSSCAGNPQMVADLLAHGADANDHSTIGPESALSLSQARHHWEATEALQHAGAVTPPETGSPSEATTPSEATAPAPAPKATP